MATNLVEGDEAAGEAATKQVFTPYVCRTIDRGIPHPGDVAEAASLAAVPLPPSSYPLWDSIPAAIVDSGKLSKLQLEGILYACTKHLELLPSGERAGFFIGDGAGVGKGRQISGVVLDNFARGRRRALWLSTSTDLHADASRDLRDLGAHLRVINNVGALDRESRALGLSREYQEGVLFMTYSTLISQVKGRSRLSQVVDWLVSGSGTNGGATANDAAASEWEGLVVLDECHKAKNFAPGKEAASTKVAAAVIELQARLPRARVLYCSATGISEVANMAYLTRMGLWGPGTAFNDFNAFLDSMKRRGVSFLEMLAMEMKAEGKYVARGLSFRDAEFMEVESPLTAEQVRMYDNAVQVWCRVRSQLENALAASGGGRDAWKVYWATLQRFFKLLCVSIKIPTVVAEAREALAADECVVIGLQSTGEAAADAVGLEPGPVAGFVSPTKEMLLRFVRQHFPVRGPAADGPAAASVAAAMAAAAAGGGGGNTGAYGFGDPADGGPLVPDPWSDPVAYRQLHGAQGQGGMDGKGAGHRDGANGEAGAAGGAQGADGAQGPLLPALVSMRDELLAEIEALQLPPNFLDQLIDELGGPGAVAEMTGRKGRVVRAAGGGGGGGGGAGAGRARAVYELRAKPDTSDMDSLNITEKDAFMRGDKRVAIISDAASTGISLHACRTAANTRRRRHLTIELPWSADKAIQQLGRSHRSNQVTAPVYKLISTRVGGEKRFAAAVARRLQSLGALTRGDRRAASGLDLAGQNFDSPIGRKSLRRMYDYIVLSSPTLPPGVRLADIFREHPALAKMLQAASGRTPATKPRRTPAAGNGTNGHNGHNDADADVSLLFDFDDPAVVSEHVAALHAACRGYCDTMGVDLPSSKQQDTVAEDTGAVAGDPKGGGDVRRFLNRLLGLRVEHQGLLFAYFSAVLAAEIRAARAEGKWSEGLADVAGSRIWRESCSVLWVDPLSSLTTNNNAFSVDRGLSWEAAQRRLERERLPGDASGFRRSRRPFYGGTHLVLLALQKPGARNVFSICRPNTGASLFDMDRDELDARYGPPAAAGSPEEAEVAAAWRAMYDTTRTHCMHGPDCRAGPGCGVGRRVTRVHVLSGSVVRVWGVLEAVLARRENELSKMDRAIRVVRVEWDSADNGEDEESQPLANQQPQGTAEGTEQEPQSPQITLSGDPSADGLTNGAAAVTSTAASVRSPPPPAATAGTPSRATAAALASPSVGGRRRGSADGAGGGGDGGGRRVVGKLEHVVGVRFPGQLLPEVVAQLAAAAAAAAGQATLTRLPGGGVGLGAPAVVAGGGRSVAEAATPIDKKALATAFRAPKTLMDFFRKPGETQGAAAAGGTQGAPTASAPGAPKVPMVLTLPLGIKQEAQAAKRQRVEPALGGKEHTAPPQQPSLASSLAAPTQAAKQQQQQGGCALGARKGAPVAAKRGAEKDDDEIEWSSQEEQQAGRQGIGRGGIADTGQEGMGVDEDMDADPGGDQDQDQDRDSSVVILGDDEEEPGDGEGEAGVADDPRQGSTVAAHIAGRIGSTGIGAGTAGNGAGLHPEATPPQHKKQQQQPAVRPSAAAVAHGKGQPAAGVRGVQTQLGSWGAGGRGGGGAGAYGSSGTQQQHTQPYASSGSGGAANGPGVDPAKIRALVGMGFPPAQAAKALWMAKGSVDRAAELCLEGRVV